MPVRTSPMRQMPRAFSVGVAAILAAMLLGARSVAQDVRPPVRLPGAHEVSTPSLYVATEVSPEYSRQVSAALTVLQAQLCQLFQLDPNRSRLSVYAFKTDEALQKFRKDVVKDRGSTRGGYDPVTKSVYLRFQGDAFTLAEIAHETTHHFTHEGIFWPPPWLDEGVAMYYQFSRMEASPAKLGLRPRGDVEELKKILADGKTVPLAKLMAMEYEDFHVKNVDTERLHYEQSWTLTHFIVHGAKWSKGKDAKLQARAASYYATYGAYYAKLKQRSAKPEDRKKALEETFGKLDAEQLEKDWKQYVSSMEADADAPPERPPDPTPPKDPPKR